DRSPLHGGARRHQRFGPHACRRRAGPPDGRALRILEPCVHASALGESARHLAASRLQPVLPANVSARPHELPGPARSRTRAFGPGGLSQAAGALARSPMRHAISNAFFIAPAFATPRPAMS